MASSDDLYPDRPSTPSNHPPSPSVTRIPLRIADRPSGATKPEIIGRSRNREVDDGPTQADIERFGGVTRPCRSCRSDVYDDATMCPHCGQLLDLPGDHPSKRSSLPFVLMILAMAFIIFLMSGGINLLPRSTP